MEKIYKIPISKYNKCFAERGRPLIIYALCEMQTDEYIEVRFCFTIFAKFILLLALPVLYIISIFESGIKEANEAILDIFFDKSRNKVSKESFNKKLHPKAWNKLIYLIEEKYGRIQ